jgi:hypothetical protein
VSTVDANDQGPSRISELRTSARGWHGVQLAVLGFIGLCGVLQSNAGSGKPDWLQVLAGVGALVAFGLACAATVLVALAAWPLYAARPRPQDAGPDPDEDEELARTSRRLRRGIILTFVAVAVLALAASSGWWPIGTGGEQVQGEVAVDTATGQVCGTVAAPSGPGVLALTAGGRVVEVPLSEVQAVHPVDGC